MNTTTTWKTNTNTGWKIVTKKLCMFTTDEKVTTFKRSEQLI